MILNRILIWFYGTPIGGLLFEFLLWLDRRKLPTRYLTPKEIAQVVRQYSLVDEGVKQVKARVNELITSKSAEEYDKALKQIEDMVTLGEQDAGTPKALLAQSLRQMYVKKGSQDIVTLTERAKMVDQRIQDMYILHEHINKRNLLREIRKNKTEGNIELVSKLEQEYKEKYGRNSRH